MGKGTLWFRTQGPGAVALLKKDDWTNNKP